MRKLILLLAVALAFVSCLSSPTSMPPQDLGVYNPKNLPQSELCTLRIMGYLKVIQIDENPVKWVASVRGRQTIIQIPMGVHTFKVEYNDGDRYTTSPITLIAIMLGGRNYLMDYRLDAMYVRLNIIDEETKKNATLSFNFDPNSPSFVVMTNFMGTVITPTGDKEKKTVTMENSDWMLVFKPDMIFTLTNKQKNETVKGKRGFIIDFTSQVGKVYLLIADPDAMTTEDFLKNSSYTSKSEYILAPVECTNTKVKFKVEKPADLAGTFWEFDIAVSTEGEQK